MEVSPNKSSAAAKAQKVAQEASKSGEKVEVSYGNGSINYKYSDQTGFKSECTLDARGSSIHLTIKISHKSFSTIELKFVHKSGSWTVPSGINVKKTMNKIKNNLTKKHFLIAKLSIDSTLKAANISPYFLENTHTSSLRKILEQFGL